MLKMSEAIKRNNAINMYMSGTGKKKIRKALRISKGKLDYWIQWHVNNVNKKATALRMYFEEGSGRYFICKKLSLDKKILDNWIYEHYTIEIEKRSVKENEDYKKRIAERMYFTEGRGKAEICKDLNISKVQFDKYLNGEALTKKGCSLKTQNGYNAWVSQIINKSRIS
jgi:transposase-like protein